MILVKITSSIDGCKKKNGKKFKIWQIINLILKLNLNDESNNEDEQKK